jgi:hypothetical protein
VYQAVATLAAVVVADGVLALTKTVAQAVQAS